MKAEEWLNARLALRSSQSTAPAVSTNQSNNNNTPKNKKELDKKGTTTITTTNTESDQTSYVLEGVQQYPIEIMVQLLTAKAAEMSYNPGEHAFYVSLLGEVYEKHNLLDKAVESYKEACSEMEDLISLLTLTEANTSEHRAKLAAYLNNLGLSYRNNGAFYEAEAAYKRALEISQDNKIVAQHTLGNLGRLYTLMGQPETLTIITKQMKQIRLSDSVRVNAENCAQQLDKATQLWENGEYKEAATICKQAILFFEGKQQKEQQQHPQLQQLITTQQQLEQPLLPPDEITAQLLVAWHTLLSKIYLFAQKYDKSLSVLQKLLQHNLRNSKSSSDVADSDTSAPTSRKSLATAHTLYELSVVCGLKGDYQMASAYAKKSYDILSQFRHDYMTARTTLAVAIYDACLRFDKKDEEADVEAQFSEALLECGEYTRGKSILALCLLAFAFYCAQISKITEALDNFEAALNIFMSLLSANSVVLQLAHRIVQLCVAHNNFVKAKKIINNVFDVLHKGGSSNSASSGHLASMKSILDNITNNNEHKSKQNTQLPQFSGYGSFQKEIVYIIWELEKQLLKLKLCTNKQCEKQETSSQKFLRCSQCKNTVYCSKECQKVDWKAHKPNCVNKL